MFIIIIINNHIIFILFFKFTFFIKVKNGGG